MRFMKNSSRFEPTIARNLTRSRSGFRSSSASASTRRLNASQVSSRLRYSPELLRSASRSSLDMVEATTSGTRPEPFLRVVASVMPVWRRERSLLQEVYRLITGPGSLLPVLFGAFGESGGADGGARRVLVFVRTLAAHADRADAPPFGPDGQRTLDWHQALAADADHA